MNKTVYPNYTILRSVTIIYVDIMKKIYRCLYNHFNRPTYIIKFYIWINYKYSKVYILLYNR